MSELSGGWGVEKGSGGGVWRVVGEALERLVQGGGVGMRGDGKRGGKTGRYSTAGGGKTRAIALSFQALSVTRMI